MWGAILQDGRRTLPDASLLCSRRINPRFTALHRTHETQYVRVAQFVPAVSNPVELERLRKCEYIPRGVTDRVMDGLSGTLLRNALDADRLCLKLISNPSRQNPTHGS